MESWRYDLKKDFDRKQGIGGSDATRLYEGDWHQLWSEKIGDSVYPDLSDVLPVQMGIHTESFNISWFEKLTKLKVDGKQETFFHPKYKYMYAHVDGLILDEDKAILECKHTNAFSNAKKVSDKYKAQLQHYLMVCNYPKIYLSVFFGNLKHEIIEVTEDKKFQEQLENAEILFWNFVTSKKEPPEYISFDNFNTKEMNGETIIPIVARK